MERAIDALPSFDYSTTLSKYVTVMFSTGPMFLSAIYGASPRRMPGTRDGVRVLPRALYGKYAVEGEGADAFFAHYFASSWHGNDAGFVQFVRLLALLSLDTH
jgi:mannosyltransferase OCH1-like enzyme